jgi:molybdopterin-guanine dinucleotide biosynthesis protein
MTHKAEFPNGAVQVLPYVQEMWSFYKCTQMSEAQMTYLEYFDQVLVKGFMPLSKSLTLSKIVLVSDIEEFDQIKHDDDDTPQVLLDPNDFAKGLYLKVFNNSQCIYD